MRSGRTLAFSLYGLALLLYTFGFLGSFSIGLYMLLPAMFVLFNAIAINLGLYKKRKNYVVPVVTAFVIVGITWPVWHYMVHNVDDYYIFFPFAIFF